MAYYKTPKAKSKLLADKKFANPNFSCKRKIRSPREQVQSRETAGHCSRPNFVGRILRRPEEKFVGRKWARLNRNAGDRTR